MIKDHAKREGSEEGKEGGREGEGRREGGRERGRERGRGREGGRQEAGRDEETLGVKTDKINVRPLKSDIHALREYSIHKAICGML